MNQNLPGLFFGGPYTGNLIATVGLVVFVIVFRFAALRFIREVEKKSDAMRLRWTVTFRNVSIVLFLLGMVVIWASELRTFALSVVALAAALVLATKELILCMSGSMLRATSGSFHIGNRIEIDGVRGEVIDHGLLSTTILEVGTGHQRTGRTVVVPNSLLLTKPVTNETLSDEYVLHVVNVPSPRDEHWDEREAALLAAAREACGDYQEPTRRAMDEINRKHGLPGFSVEPRTVVEFTSPTALTLAVRIPTPARERGRTEQRILRRYLELTEEFDRARAGAASPAPRQGESRP